MIQKKRDRRVKSYRVAEAMAQAIDIKLPHDDYCGFAWDVGNALASMTGQRDSRFIFDAEYLALGILSWVERHRDQAEVADKPFKPGDLTRALNAHDQERRNRLRAMLRLATVDGKPVD
jgi:hypothetical protein